MLSPLLLIHGGAGLVSRQTCADLVELSRKGLRKTQVTGFQELENCGANLSSPQNKGGKLHRKIVGVIVLPRQSRKNCRL